MLPRLPSGAGNEFAGEIAATGPGANRLQHGDRIWGVVPHLTVGSMADYVAVSEELVGMTPDGLHRSAPIARRRVTR